ncbi:MAG: anti-sigma factor, partial [Bacteroidetes bacterium]|nr:anti-sigma factor [Bacteroidota bacterium]
SGIIEQYVLGLAPAEEAASLEQLRLNYPELNEAIISFEKNFENHLLSNPVPPPTEIKSLIEMKLFNEHTGVKHLMTEHTTEKNITTGGIWKWLVAACIILLISSTALNFYFYSGYKNSKQQYQTLLDERNVLMANNATMKKSIDMYEDTSMMRIDMKPMPGKEQNTATILWDKNTKDVYINTANMQKTPTGMQYQLWAIVDGKPVDAGMIGDCAGLCKMKKISNAQAFAITLEKQGGSSKPTMNEMYVSGKV